MFTDVSEVLTAAIMGAIMQAIVLMMDAVSTSET
jgi:hypothetical protein